jgi:ribA/ribD-fused uncharacterized protein
MPEQMITSFTGGYRFLSNFHEGSPFRMDAIPGLWMPTGEHAFQAAKATTHDDMMRIVNAGSPMEAKKLGRQIRCQPHWDSYKRRVMLHVLLAKFTGPMAELLCNTGDAVLVEGNQWGDAYWGAVPAAHAMITRGRPGEPPVWQAGGYASEWLAGHNWLGRLLMMVRETLA